ncbi:MAG: hypothetical protein RR536_01930 [Anaerovoracaceae bacterium]
MKDKFEIDCTAIWNIDKQLLALVEYQALITDSTVDDVINKALVSFLKLEDKYFSEI